MKWEPEEQLTLAGDDAECYQTCAESMGPRFIKFPYRRIRDESIITRKF